MININQELGPIRGAKEGSSSPLKSSFFNKPIKKNYIFLKYCIITIFPSISTTFFILYLLYILFQNHGKSLIQDQVYQAPGSWHPALQKTSKP